MDNIISAVASLVRDCHLRGGLRCITPIGKPIIYRTLKSVLYRDVYYVVLIYCVPISDV